MLFILIVIAVVTVSSGMHTILAIWYCDNFWINKFRRGSTNSHKHRNNWTVISLSFFKTLGSRHWRKTIYILGVWQTGTAWRYGQLMGTHLLQSFKNVTTWEYYNYLFFVYLKGKDLKICIQLILFDFSISCILTPRRPLGRKRPKIVFFAIYGHSRA